VPQSEVTLISWSCLGVTESPRSLSIFLASGRPTPKLSPSADLPLHSAIAYCVIVLSCIANSRMVHTATVAQ